MSVSTDLSIIESFKQEAREKGVVHVTMGSVAERCGCARQTIYYHFRGNMDLIKWILLNEYDGITYDSLERNRWKNEMYRLLTTLKNNDWLFTQIYESKMWNEFSDLLVTTISSNVVQPFFLTCTDCGTARNRENISRIITFAFAGQTIDWMRKGFTESPMELMKDFDRLCGSAMYRLIEDFLVLRPRDQVAEAN